MSNEKHYILEYKHDNDGGATVIARPTGGSRNDYWVKDIARINFKTETINLKDCTISFSMIQEIVHHLHELATQHLEYIKHMEDLNKEES